MLNGAGNSSFLKVLEQGGDRCRCAEGRANEALAGKIWALNDRFNLNITQGIDLIEMSWI